MALAAATLGLAGLALWLGLFAIPAAAAAVVLLAQQLSGLEFTDFMLKAGKPEQSEQAPREASIPVVLVDRIGHHRIGRQRIGGGRRPTHC